MFSLHSLKDGPVTVAQSMPTSIFLLFYYLLSSSVGIQKYIEFVPELAFIITLKFEEKKQF